MAVNNRCGLNIKKCTSSKEVSGPQHVRSECNNRMSYLLKYVFTEFTMYVLTVLYILHQILDIILDLHMKRYVVPWYRSQRHSGQNKDSAKWKI